MKIKQAKSNKNNILEGAFILIPSLFNDSRGFFYESWNNKEFKKLIGKNIDFVQDNHSRSSYGVLRGLHFQKKPHSQGKLVRVINGEIYDVIVDLRLNSKTFGEWGIFKLSRKNKNQLWIPEGYAHGFLTKTKIAEVLYKTTDYWEKDSERTLFWKDNTININWHLDDFNLKKPNISKKDADGKSLNYFLKNNELF